ncbi:MAG: protein kinase domain-containing protein [Bradymonadia bacterium]
MTVSGGPSWVPCPKCGHRVSSDLTHCGSCGQVMPEPGDPPEDWVGREIDGKYDIEEILGIGGMGMVFRARRMLVGDDIALKVLFPRFYASPLQRRLFQDEAIAAARLSHPNVVTIFDADITADGRTAYIAMELLEGQTLKQLLRAKAPMDPSEILPIAIEITHALSAAHAEHIVHRDLKPDNVYLEAREDDLDGVAWRMKLVDFGIAAMLDAEPRDEQERLFGTLRYMSPEQCLGDELDGRSDLYSLGVILYEALTRRRVSGRTVTSIIQDAVIPPNQLLPPNKRLPESLEALVLDLLSKHRDDRPSDALTVCRQLEMIRGQLSAGAIATGSHNIPQEGAEVHQEDETGYVPFESISLNAPPEYRVDESLDQSPEPAPARPALIPAPETLPEPPDPPPEEEEATSSGRGRLWFWVGVILATMGGIAAGVTWHMLKNT